MIFRTYLAIASIAKRKLLAENYSAFSVAAYGPDLVDKTLNLTYRNSGAGCGSFYFDVGHANDRGCLANGLELTNNFSYIGLILWSSHLITDLVQLKILMAIFRTFS